jgi:hypothetical protein
MKKALIRLSLSIAILIAFSCAWLYSNRSRPIIFSFSPDPDMVRPRNYCLLNPFRDKSPEIIGENHLKALRKGDVESIRPFLHYEKDDQEHVDHILDNEKKWPIQSWRIGERVDMPGETELMFWVTRGGGYSKDLGEEEVRLWIKQSGSGWSLNSYSAIY